MGTLKGGWHMKDFLKRFELSREQWLGVIRHILTSTGPLLAYFGLEVEEKVWLVVVGILMSAIGFLWSVKAPEKKHV